MLQFVRKFYRAVLPERIRRSRLLSSLRGTLYARRGLHDFVYDDAYYRREVEEAAGRSAGPMCASIVRDLRPRSVVDVGCGTGALLAALREKGCDVHGLEYSSAGLERCRRRGLPVTKFDLEHDEWTPGRSFDVCISLEVAEHLPAGAASDYIGLLTRLAPAVVFTAASPGQGGWDHVNEQPPDYWIGKFGSRGFEPDAEIARRWQDEWREHGVEHWYCDNLLVFRRSNR